MALKKETIAQIANVLKVKTEDLETAIKAEAETDLTFGPVSTFTDDEITTLKNNEYNRGKTTGTEIAVKETKEKLKLDFQGKTLEGLIEAASKKALADAKIEPEKKVTELQDKITNLQTTVQDYEKKLADKDAEVANVKTTGELYKYIPEPGENGPALGKDDVIQLMKANGYDFKMNESGALVPYKGGKEVQDKLSNPRAVNDVIQEFMKEKKLIPGEAAAGGRGGGDNKPGAKATTLSELSEQFKAQGKDTKGLEFSEAVEKAVAENKDFALDK
jgi:hypothetical protein